MKKIITFGEILKRISPKDNHHLIGQQSCDVFFGGSEINVAVSLRKFGHDVEVVTKLPCNSYGDAALAVLNGNGVGTSFVARGGERLGEYLCEPGLTRTQRVCTYDRKYSAMATATEEDFCFEDIFKEAGWFHVSGITPALSPDLQEIVVKACALAKEMGLTVSFDVNYRAKLWSKEEASACVKEIMPYVDVLLVNEDEVSLLFDNVSGGSLLVDTQSDEFRTLVEMVQDKYPNLSTVTSCARLPSKTNDCAVRAAYWSKDEPWVYFSNIYDVDVIDPIGAGDAFCAALISAIMTKNFWKSKQVIVEIATAAAALKHKYAGDFNLARMDDVKKLFESYCDAEHDTKQCLSVSR